MENEVRTREVGTRMMQDGTGVKNGEISLNFINRGRAGGMRGGWSWEVNEKSPTQPARQVI